MTIIGIIIVVIITDFTLVLCISDREVLGTRWNGGKKYAIYEFQKPLLSSRGCVQTVSSNNDFLLFYHHFAIHTKYTDKIVKKKNR